MKTEIAGAACENQGKILGDYVIAQTNGHAHAMFVGTTTYNCNVQRLQGFKYTFSKSATCSLKVIEFAIADLTTTLTSQITSAIEANPSVTYIAGTFDQVALDATIAVRNQGKSNSIKVVGFDGNAPDLALIKSNDIQVADCVTGQLDSGWEAVDAAARVHSGIKIPDNIAPSIVLITHANIKAIGSQFDEAKNSWRNSKSCGTSARSLTGLSLRPIGGAVSSLQSPKQPPGKLVPRGFAGRCATGLTEWR